MKISNILIALTLVFAIACNGKSSGDHGHEHTDGDHEHGHPHNEQEEFTVNGDSTQVEKTGTHKHEDGTKHHDH